MTTRELQDASATRVAHSLRVARELDTAQKYRVKTPAQQRIERHWTVWIPALFPFLEPDTFAPHHAKFWNWVWSVKQGKRARPFIAIWPRGGGKSTSVELAVTSMVCRGERLHVWYISETQENADQHVQNISIMLEAAELQRLYPDVGKPAVNQMGMSRGWKAKRLTSAAGFTILAIGLDTAKRGFKVGFERPDLIIFDDIDGIHDTPETTKKKIEKLTMSLLPSRDTKCGTVLGVQNLIHRNSIFAQLADGRAGFLADKLPVSGPIPALRNFKYEKAPEGSGHKWLITSGEPTWPHGMGLKECQESLDTYDLEGFLRECQHKVDIAQEGAILPEYNEVYHVITRSEFMRVYGKAALKDPDNPESGWRIPLQGTHARGHDWGTTKAHPSVVLYGWRPYEGMPVNDGVFIVGEIVRPEFPVQDNKKPFVNPARVKRAMFNQQLEWGIEEDAFSGCSWMSHEATAALNTYLEDQNDGLGIVYFNKWEGGMHGVPQIQNYLEIDFSKPHPFRRYPVGHPLAGKPLPGRPRFFIVVEDDQGELFCDEEGELRVRSWRDAEGMARLRWEIPLYSNHILQTGEESHKPKSKKNDDAIDSLKGFFEHFVPLEALTIEDKAEQMLDPALSKEALEYADEDQQGRIKQSRDYWINSYVNEQRRKNQHWLQAAEDQVMSRDEEGFEDLITDDYD